jgi:Mg2+/Co2+ transporter CorC
VCTIDEFRREFPALKESDEVDTMGGILVQALEYVPTAGEFASVDGLRLTARQVDERRVLELEVEVLKR